MQAEGFAILWCEKDEQATYLSFATGVILKALSRIICFEMEAVKNETVHVSRQHASDDIDYDLLLIGPG